MTLEKAPLVVDTSSNNTPRRRNPSLNMRSGPRLVCSPYFVFAALILLSFISMKYWSLSSQNDELSERLEALQQQMKTETLNVKNLQASLTQKDQVVQDTVKSKKDLQTEIEERKDEIRRQKEDMGTIQREKATCAADLEDMTNKLDECERSRDKVNEEVQTDLEKVRLENEKVNSDLEKVKLENEEKELEISELKSKVQNLNDDLKALKATELEGDKKVQNGLDGNGLKELGPGELGDVDPSAVHVKEKAVEGMKFHKDSNGRYLPLLPQSDPEAPRKKPQFSVLNPPKDEKLGTNHVGAINNQESVIAPPLAGDEEKNHNHVDKINQVDQLNQVDQKVQKQEEEEEARNVGREEEEMFNLKKPDNLLQPVGKNFPDAGQLEQPKKVVNNNNNNNPDAREADDNDGRGNLDDDEDQDPDGDLRGEREDDLKDKIDFKVANPKQEKVEDFPDNEKLEDQGDQPVVDDEQEDQ